MRLEVIGAGLGKSAQVEPLIQQPAFRKATRNMALAFAAADAALAVIDRETLPAHAPENALVLGTCFGELDTTREFLDGFYEQKLARPLLFQSSLHNATTGFLAIQLKLTGPSFTLTRGVSSGLAALELAAALCSSGACKTCLVLSVEARITGLETLLRPHQVQNEDDGAAALLIGVEGAAAALGAVPRAHLENADTLVPGFAGDFEVDATPQLAAPLATCPVNHLATSLLGSDAAQGQLDLQGHTEPRVLRWRRVAP
jgi:acetyl-CoA acetyltransferase